MALSKLTKVDPKICGICQTCRYQDDCLVQTVGGCSWLSYIFAELPKRIANKDWEKGKVLEISQGELKYQWRLQWGLSSFWEKVFAVTINPIFMLLGLAWKFFPWLLLISIIWLIIAIIFSLF